MYRNTNRLSVLSVVTLGVLAAGLLVAPWALADPPDGKNDGKATGSRTGSKTKSDRKEEAGARTMQVFYLVVVTREVDAVCAAYAAALGVEFSEPDAGLGNARTAAMPGGGMVGVRAPLRDTEEPVVRPYWLVDDINAALASAEKAGGQVAHPPMEIPGHGTFAIYLQGGNDHGLWQR